jgi:hypothetical protein
MKKNKPVYIVALMLACANCCFAQQKLASEKKIQSFYSQKTKAYLDKKKPAPGAAAVARPVLTSQKPKHDLALISKKYSVRRAKQQSKITPVHNQKQLPSNSITMAQFSRQSLDKRNKKGSQF